MNFAPTDLPPGAPEKIELMRQRAEYGLPLFHPKDRGDYAGMSGGYVTTTVRRAARPGKQIIKLMTSGRKMREE
jgi:hypothetical protein